MMSDNAELSRRSFIQSTAAMGAGLLLSSSVYGEKQTGKSDDINVALIGAGAQGQVLLDSYLKIPGLRFKAVCDIWAQYNLKRVTQLLKKYRHEVNSYVDYQQLLDTEKDLDAAIIATPDFWHGRHTIACLKKGLHVYCEKEMSNSLDEARQMVEVARQTGKLLQIGHQRRSNPRYIHCYDKVIKQAQLLGRITAINSQWNRAVRPDLGWPKKYAIEQAILQKYGYEDMHQFRNWRWYKGLGGGPVVDLGSHQIDIFNWFLDSTPAAVVASGGTDYYDKKNHEWYDTVMAIYEYDTKKGKVRAYYQTLTTNSSFGYYENFLGDQGTLAISEAANRGAIYRESSAPDWNKWVKLGILSKPQEEEKPAEEGESDALLDVRETLAPPTYEIPVKMEKKYHQPHLENFFNSIRGQAKLNCNAVVGYETAATVLKVNEAIEAQRRLEFKPEELRV